MTVWLPWFWLLLVLVYPATGQDKHYMGGSISFTWSNKYTCTLTVITGWKLGKGPCGVPCDLQKIGKATRVTRRKMEEDNGNSYFGKWDVSVDASNFHQLLKSSMSSYVSALNTPGLWEQEVMKVDVQLWAEKHAEIRLSSLFWTTFKYNYTQYVSSVLQVDLSRLARNDTSLPNNSPVVMFKPVYRIPLNESTKIVLSTMDKDDDFVRCEVSQSTLTHVKTMPKTTISEDCSITVEANERYGFSDKGYGIVSLVARDFNKHVITVGGETRTIGDARPLSTVMVQFMVQTVKVDEGPSFLPPTRESQHVFVVYTGSVLEIPLYATYGPLIFHARSLPQRLFKVPLPQRITFKGKTMASTTVTWKPTEGDVGFYLFSASVIDDKWRDGMDRNYKIIVKAASTTPSTTVTTTTTTNTTTTKPTSTTTTTPTSTTSTTPTSTTTTTTTTTTTPTSTTSTLAYITTTHTSTTTTTPTTTTTATTTPTTTTTIPPTTTTTTTPTTTSTRSTTITTTLTTTYSTTSPTTTTPKTSTTTNTTTTSLTPSTTTFTPTTTTNATTTKTTKSTITTTSSTTVITNTIPTTTTTRPTTTDATSITLSTKATTAIPAKPSPINMIHTAINVINTATTTIATTTTTTRPTTTTTTPTTTTTTPTTTASKASTITNSKAFTTPTASPLNRGIHQPSASTASADPSVHLPSTSSSGFPSCSEVVNPHPSNQCLCLSGIQLIQCPSRKFGTVNSQMQDETGRKSVVVPVLGCVAGLTAGVIAIFVIKRFCCPCSKTNKVSADSLESLKQEDDEEHYVDRKSRRHHPHHQRNNPRAPGKLYPRRS